MKTTVDIDDELMARAMEASGANTKQETIELALTELIRNRNLKAFASAFGSQPELRELARGQQG
jgi:Arc/MetJ family transcription regulator